MLELIDSHCHLDDDRLNKSRSLLLIEARKVGIQHFIVPATTQQRWPLLHELQQKNSDIHIAYGYHPMFMNDHTNANMEELEQFITEHKAIAVGECGLDFFHSKQDEKEQKILFEQQLDVAKNLSLPCIIHSRKSLDSIISLLRKKQLKGGVLHSFSGSLQQARQLNDLGFKLGIAATVCFDRAKKLQSIVRETPLEFLLLESDAPDQTGPDYKGLLNQPAYMLKQLNKVAELKNIKASDVATQTSQNCHSLFALN
jgi:TatD DNase family protein